MNSKSDGEVIAHLYEEFGELWVEKVEGMFAVAIWDINKQELLLYRDRFGKKPLYYTSADDGIAFSSEIRVLKKLLNLKRADCDSNSINLFLNLGYIPNPKTVYKHIYKLEPGFFLKFQNFQTKLSKYFSLNLNQIFHDDKLYSVTSYNSNTPFIPGFNLNFTTSSGTAKLGWIMAIKENQPDGANRRRRP